MIRVNKEENVSTTTKQATEGKEQVETLTYGIKIIVTNNERIKKKISPTHDLYLKKKKNISRKKNPLQ